VDNAVVNELYEARADLLQVVDGLGFRKHLIFSESCTQVAAITVLLRYVVVIGCLEDVHEAHDVLAVKLAHDFYLGYQRIFNVLVMVNCICTGLTHLFGEYFDGYHLLGVLVDSLENFAEGALTEFLVERDHEIFNSLLLHYYYT